MKVCLGGTFHPFHVGHEALLRTAMEEATDVFVGVTQGHLARRKNRDVPPWEERARQVERFFAREGFRGEVLVGPLTDGVGPAVEGDFDAIVVSPETIDGAEVINERRGRAGRPALLIRVVPHVLAGDLLPVSSTRIHAGDIDRDGHRITPVRVAAGSANPVKVSAIESEVARILSLPVQVRGLAVASGVAEQPQAGEALLGARNRAQAAMEAWPEADYAVGVEAGLQQDPDGFAWYDVQACAVVDRLGHTTDGFGPAFRYPDWITERALAGEMVSDVIGPVANDPRIGGTTGAIGFLTGGLMDRTELSRIAVLMAFVPRIRRGLYVTVPGSSP